MGTSNNKHVSGVIGGIDICIVTPRLLRDACGTAESSHFLCHYGTENDHSPCSTTLSRGKRGCKCSNRSIAVLSLLPSQESALGRISLLVLIERGIPDASYYSSLQ